MKMKLYVETSIISYLTSRPSRDVVAIARQELTRETWSGLIPRFEAYVSALVIQEASQGDPEASAARLKALDGLAVLDVTDDAKALARKLIERRTVPDTHLEDALHVAVAAINGMDFLLTWNFAHLNNAFARFGIREAIETEGYRCPEICSPEELLGEER